MDMGAADECVFVIILSLPSSGGINRVLVAAHYGTGFKPSSYMTSKGTVDSSVRRTDLYRSRSNTPYILSDVTTVRQEAHALARFDMPHMIMTYTALLSLAVLRDDFTKLDRPGIIQVSQSLSERGWQVFVAFPCFSPLLLLSSHTHRLLLSFSTMPGEGDTDLRTLYCAFSISSMLDDWSGVNLHRALDFIAACRVRSLNDLRHVRWGRSP